jgi:hypothetical protein
MNVPNAIYNYHMEQASMATPEQIAAVTLKVGEYFLAVTNGYAVTIVYRPGEVCESILFVGTEMGFVLNADQHRALRARANATGVGGDDARWEAIDAAWASRSDTALARAALDFDEKYHRRCHQ